MLSFGMPAKPVLMTAFHESRPLQRPGLLSGCTCTPACQLQPCVVLALVSVLCVRAHVLAGLPLQIHSAKCIAHAMTKP